MRATVCHRAEFDVADIPEPVPGEGQIVVEVLRAGICGSDLHARTHCDDMADLAADTGYDRFMRSTEKVVLGHEFSGVVVDYGKGCRKRWKPGTPVVALPIVRTGDRTDLVGLSAAAPGAFAEYVLVQEAMTMAVPNGLDAAPAALTEPMAVARHAVRRGAVGRNQTAIVIGCGPVGLAVVAMLKATGVKHVVASDFSQRRRDLAAQCGADIVVDPREQDPWTSYPKRGELTGAADLLDAGIDAMEKLRYLPKVPWWHIFRVADTLGAMPSGPVVFECVGLPGMIDQILRSAPIRSRVVVVGVCMETDRFQPALAVNKEIDMRFVLGYDPGEFRETLHLLADGKVDPAPLITGTVGLAGVSEAFTALADPQTHAKILVDPAR